MPPSIARPPYADSGKLPGLNDRFEVHDAAAIAKMRASCRLAAQVLQHAGSLVKAGVTTDEIDAAVHQMVVEAGAYPSPLNYGKFPKSVCTSVNECLCHGIPDARCAGARGAALSLLCSFRGGGGGGGAASTRARALRRTPQFPQPAVFSPAPTRSPTSPPPLANQTSKRQSNTPITNTRTHTHTLTDSPLRDGDIVNIDVTVYLDGYHGDTSAMFYVGEPSPTARRLCEATREALDEAIKVRGGAGGGGRGGGGGRLLLLDRLLADADSFFACLPAAASGAAALKHAPKTTNETNAAPAPPNNNETKQPTDLRPQRAGARDRRRRRRGGGKAQV